MLLNSPNKICYSCGLALRTKNDIQSGQAIDHEEHIIQDALHGRLRATGMLCQDCGGRRLGRIDRGFVSHFNIFTNQIGKFLASTSHGKEGKVGGHILLEGERVEIVQTPSGAYPKVPRYRYNSEDNVLTLYGSEKALKHYRTKALTDVSIQEGISAKSIKVEIGNIIDVSDEKSSMLHFYGDNEEFNNSMQMGINKIAVGFASAHGVERKLLNRALRISSEGSADFADVGNVWPFVPLWEFDKLFEDNRIVLDPMYPSHSLILFTQEYADGRRPLYCYVDLFSTFQFYVLLGDHIPTSGVFESYFQRTRKQSVPEYDLDALERDDPKHLLYVVEKELQIDRTKVAGKSQEEWMAHVKKEYANMTPSYEMTADEWFNEVYENICSHVMESIYKNREIHERVLSILGPSRGMEAREYRTVVRTMADRLSYPNELAALLRDSWRAAHGYGERKFQQLVSFTNKLRRTA